MYSNKPVLVAKDVNVFMTANSSQGNQDSWPRGAHGGIIDADRQQTATATSLKEKLSHLKIQAVWASVI